MIEVVKTPGRVGDGKPVCVTRFRWWAVREARRHNSYVMFPSYRWEVIREDGRWKVVAMQNVARPRPDFDPRLDYPERYREGPI